MVRCRLIHYKANCFSEYVRCERDEWGRVIIPKREFSGDEFSRYEMNLIDCIVEKYIIELKKRVILRLFFDDNPDISAMLNDRVNIILR